jgi:hypothetical protein
LVVIVLILGGAILASLKWPPKDAADVEGSAGTADGAFAPVGSDGDPGDDDGTDDGAERARVSAGS